MYLLDTNIISELRKFGKGKADENVMRWFKQISLEDCYLSAITITEIQVGALAKKHKDPKQYEILEDWLMNILLPKFSKRILPMDTEVALACAELHIPDRRPINDVYIAATAKVNNLILVTRNIKDFEKCGVKLLNPFEN